MLTSADSDLSRTRCVLRLHVAYVDLRLPIYRARNALKILLDVHGDFGRRSNVA